MYVYVCLCKPKSKLVEDALKDPRFADNPLVTGEPRIRFYAGMPLEVSSNEPPVGTLCVIHDKPKKITDRQRSALSLLRKSAEDRMLLRRFFLFFYFRICS